MAAFRRIAAWVLTAMVRHSSPESRAWAEAMLREIDFIESDWPALCWALGGVTVLCRHALSRRMNATFRRVFNDVRSLKGIAKRTPAVLAGVAVAGVVLSMCLLLLSSLTRAPWFEPAMGKLADRTLFVIVPEAAYLASAAALWQRRRPVAAGILAAGAILMTHAIVHFATHG
jgi:hypothetical protein